MKEVRYDSDAIHMVSLLSELLRRSYDTNKLFVTIDDEISYAEKYIEIQHMRYSERLSSSICVAPDVRQECTVKLILQPLIENSIIHGFIEKKSDWQLLIEAFMEDKNIVFRITDNGIGIAASELESLRHSLTSNHIKEDNGLGLSNVNNRLKLIFGTNYTLSIESYPERGTVILLRHARVLDDDTNTFHG